MSADQIRLLLLDDHVFFREGLNRLLASETGLEVVGQCGTQIEALEALRQSAVDIVLLDLSPGRDAAGDFIAAALKGGYQGKFLMVTAQHRC